MLAGGVPDRQDDHALRVANAALEMRIALARINSEKGENFEIWIGMHSGPLVAGEIQVSESTYVLLQDRFRFAARGSITLKGKGEVPAYLQLR